MRMHERPFLLDELKLEVTHRCNLKCIHCSSEALESSGVEMSKENCLRIIEEAAAMGAKAIAFSGGEPCLWEHIEDVVGLACDRNLKVRIYTSGNAPEIGRRMQAFKRHGIERIVFSIHGASATSHDSVTLVSGSFDRMRAALSLAGSLGLPTELHFVPLADNYEELPTIAELARRLSVPEISVLRFVPQGRGKTGEGRILDRSQNLELRRMIMRLRQEGHEIRTGSPYNFLMIRKEPKCCSGINRLIIRPDLRIAPCDAFKDITPEALGVSSEYSSLGEKNLRECWEKSPYLGAVRSYLTTPFAEECQLCKAFKKCLSGCMAQKFYAYGTLAKKRDPSCLAAAGDCQRRIMESKQGG